MYVVVDVAEVTFAASTLVNGLARLRAVISGDGAVIVVKHPSAQVRRLLAIAALPYVTLLSTDPDGAPRRDVS